MSSPATAGASAPQPSAPSAGQGSSGGESGGEAGGTGGGESFDVQEILREARAARSEAKGLRSAFDKSSKDYRQTQETLDRVKKAFVPEESAKAPDPIADLEEQMDTWLHEAMAAEAAGKKHPTADLALRYLQSQIKNHKTQEEMAKKLEALEAQLKQANDPERSLNDSAYANMEGYIQNSLDSLYGDGEGALKTKRNIYMGVVNMLQADLKELQKKAPHVWDRVRRNPGELQAIVQKAVHSIVPPKALKMLEDERVANTPQTEGQLWASYREAENIQDPAQRRAVREKIRQEILESRFNKPRRRRD